MSEPEAEKKAAEPRGVIAIITSPAGDVITTASDFNRSGAGGYKLWEAQRYRAVQQAKYAVVRAYASSVLIDALDSYVVEQIADSLLRKGKHKLSLRAVGWPDDVDQELRR